MIDIRPVSDLRNKFPEIEDAITKSNAPVFLTKNGHGAMVLMSMAQYDALTDRIERKLDEADAAAAHSRARLSESEVFDNIEKQLRATTNL